MPGLFCLNFNLSQGEASEVSSVLVFANFIMFLIYLYCK